MRKQLFIMVVFTLTLYSCNTNNNEETPVTVNPELLPVLTTTEIKQVTQTAAITGGVITSDAGTSITARGVCWSTKANPTIENSKTTNGTGIGAFTSSCTDLIAGQTYYIRAYASNNAGTGYGNTYQFTTIAETPTVTDIDGNIYHTITIGTQIWMVENLKTTKYNDGTAIANITDNSAWAAIPSDDYYNDLKNAAFCYYNNDIKNKDTYGAIYNKYVLARNKLAPIGWHVANDDEWTILENYVKVNTGTSVTIAKALSAKMNWTVTSTLGTIGYDLTANNYSGFNALPGGARNGKDGKFVNIGNNGFWFSPYSSTTAENMKGVRFRGLGFNSSVLDSYNGIKSDGFSVRCIKD